MENVTLEIEPSLIVGGRGGSGAWPNQSYRTTYLNRPVVGLKPFILTTYLLIFVLGSISNGLVIYIVGRFREVRVQSVANYYIWNLAFADLFFCLTLPFFCYATLTNDWPFGSVACKVSHAVSESNKYVGIFILVALSLDRYAASYYSLGLLRTIRVGKHVCALIWVSSTILTTPYWLYAGTVSFDDGRNSCRILWNYETMTAWLYFQFSVGFVFPLVTIFAAYVGLGLRLRKLLGGRASTAIKRPGRAMTRMTLVAALTFLVTQLPYYVMEVINGAKGVAMQSSGQLPDSVPHHEKRLFVILTSGSKILVYMASCCNPIIYGFLNKNYRKLYMEALRRWCSPATLTDLNQSERTSRRSTGRPTKKTSSRRRDGKASKGGSETEGRRRSSGRDGPGTTGPCGLGVITEDIELTKLGIPLTTVA